MVETRTDPQRQRATAQRKPTSRYTTVPRSDRYVRQSTRTRREGSANQRQKPTVRRNGYRDGGRRDGGTKDGASKRQNNNAGRFRNSKAPLFAGAIAALVVLVAVIGFAGPAIGSLFNGNPKESAAPAAVVSFVAVGDNLPDDYIGWYAETLIGEPDDGRYDYSPIFKPIASYVQDADLAYINQETHLGSNEIGPQGYPSFNTTDEMAAAVVNTGFDFVASATNHSYDWGSYGALNHSLSIWEQQPVAFTGTSVTKEQYERIATLERNGITFALLNYTYGVNGFSEADLPPYSVNFIDENRIAADVARAHEQADVVLVAMHWGTELLTEADDEQLRLAQFLADLDVDVVLGSHPHVIGPMAWVTNSKNPDHRTLVAYSLGNFLADHEYPLADNVLEGMLTCDFVREQADGPIAVENVRWIPLVCHSTEDRTDFAVYAVDDYSADLAKQCRALSELDDPMSWLYSTTHSIVGEQWF